MMYAFALVSCIGTARADLRLPAIFTNGMVLQQDTDVAVWGWADAGEQLTITASWPGAITVTVRAGAEGKWKTSMHTPRAGGPFTLRFSGLNTIELSDVMIGEVWLCSGQSNMVFSLKGSAGAAKEIATANFPAIRYFSVKRQYGPAPFEDCAGSEWTAVTSASVPGMSAVAYYFAKKIHWQLNVPIGIIYAAWGGTPAEAWTPSATIAGDTILQRYLQRWDTIQQRAGEDSAAYLSALQKWKALQATEDSNRLAQPKEPQTYYYFKRPWREPAVLFNGMINPVIPFTLKGFLWYQGESNVGYADEYRLLFSAMIDSWREAWNGYSIPFYFVQLPPYGYENLEAAARLREAQRQVSEAVPRTAMAVTMDLGNMKNIHPTRKKEVGERLAAFALHALYGFGQLDTHGPQLAKTVSHKKETVFIFDKTLGLTTGEQPGGFEAGYAVSSDSIAFFPTRSTLRGRKITIFHQRKEKPVAIRYGWVEIGKANLEGPEGLPVAPFNTIVQHQISKQ